jgi:hypothetical protein
MPYHLAELSLYHCKIGWKQTFNLLQGIKIKNQLVKLSLVRAGINEFSIPILENLVKTSKTLKDLDLSWNNMVP